MVAVPWNCIGLCVLSYTMVHISVQIITCSLPCLQKDLDFEEPWTTSDIGQVIGPALWLGGLDSCLLLERLRVFGCGTGLWRPWPMHRPPKPRSA